MRSSVGALWALLGCFVVAGLGAQEWQVTQTLSVGERWVSPPPVLAWTSSQPSIASVDPSGAVTGRSPGTCVLTATQPSGKVVSRLITVVFVQDGPETVADHWEAFLGAGRVVAEPSGTVYRFASEGPGIALQVKDDLWAALGSPTSYFVEALIRPTGDSVGDKNIGLASNISADRTAFYYSGLNFNNRLQTGVVPSNVKAYQNTSGVPILKPEGRYRADPYWLRYEVLDDGTNHTLMAFCNGIPIGKNNQAAPFVVPAAQKLPGSRGPGLYTSGASFDLIQIRVGALGSHLSSLRVATTDGAFPLLSGSIVYRDTEKSLRAGDPAVEFVPTAVRADGSSDDVEVRVAGTAVSVSAPRLTPGQSLKVTPSQPGTAVVTLSNATDPSRVLNLTFKVDKGLTYRSTDYGLTNQVWPAPGTTAGVDPELGIEFDVPPVLAADGLVQLVRASDQSLVDTIKFTGEKNTYGSRTLAVGSQLARVDGRRLVLTPHRGKLPAGTYQVLIPEGVIQGTLHQKPFTGFAPADKAWTFTVQPGPAPDAQALSVAPQGPADFRTIQAALDFASRATGDVTITLGPGVYRENLSWNTARALTLKAAPGLAPTDVVVAFENCESMNTGTDNRPVFWIGASAPRVVLEGFTLQNTRSKAANPTASNQAETLYFNNTTGVLVAKNMRFTSRQDTLLVKGFSWFYRCTVEGDIDYIWGYPDTALFEACTIRTLADDRGPSYPAYVVQSRALAGKPGFVFLDCDFPVDSGRTSAPVYLARSGGAATATDGWDSMAVVASRLSERFDPAGWNDDGKAVTPSKANGTTGWREYGNVLAPSGAPAWNPSRHPAATLLSDTDFQARYATRAAVTAGTPLAGLAP